MNKLDYFIKVSVFQIYKNRRQKGDAELLSVTSLNASESFLQNQSKKLSLKSEDYDGVLDKSNDDDKRFEINLTE